MNDRRSIKQSSDDSSNNSSSKRHRGETVGEESEAEAVNDVSLTIISIQCMIKLIVN